MAIFILFLFYNIYKSNQSSIINQSAIKINRKYLFPTQHIFLDHNTPHLSVHKFK